MFFRKSLIVILLTSLYMSSLYAMDIRIGKGDFSMKMAVLGFSGKMTTDITTITLNETHRNIFNSKFFFNFDISYMDSKSKVRVLNLYNSFADSACSMCSLCPFPPCTGCSEICSKLPSAKFEVEGFDFNLGLGYDIWQSENKKSYIGIGVLLGATAPWKIKGKSIVSYSMDFMKLMQDTDTDMIDIKLGPQIRGAYEIFPGLVVHGDSAIAFQKAWMKNDSYHIDANVDGSFFTINLGVDYYPLVNQKTKWSNIYVTAGFNYKKWLVKDVEINGVSVRNLIMVPVSDLKMETTTGYVGAGYQF